MGFKTDAIHAGQEPDPTTGAVVIPRYQTSTYVQEGLGKHTGFEYARTKNPTRSVLEANLDDLSPQVLAYAMERLLAEGALDVFSVPVQMKKSRPGALLTVLAKMEDASRLTKTIFDETTTLGVRRREEQRQTLSRRWETVDTTWGPVRVKIANMNGTVSNYAPEYEDCRTLAEAQHVPLRTVMQEAIQKYLRREQKA